MAAFLLFGTVIMLSVVALGTPAPGRTVSVANVLWDVGGFGTLILGIWLALDIEGYGLFDLWIIAAIVLWFVAAAVGRRAKDALDEGSGRFAQWHWIRTLVVVLLLADMIFKPGA
jgi:hypothetical protein